MLFCRVKGTCITIKLVIHNGSAESLLRNLKAPDLKADTVWAYRVRSGSFWIRDQPKTTGSVQETMALVHRSHQDRPSGLRLRAGINIGALIIRVGFQGILCDIYNMDTPKQYRSLLRPLYQGLSQDSVFRAQGTFFSADLVDSMVRTLERKSQDQRHEGHTAEGLALTVPCFCISLAFPSTTFGQRQP